MTPKPRATSSFGLRSRAEVQSQLMTLLREREILDQNQLEDISRRAAWLEEPLEKILLRENLVEEADILAMLSSISGVPVLLMARMEIDKQAVDCVPPRTALTYHVMPVRLKNGVLTLATDHVWEVNEEDQLRVMLGYAIQWVLSTTTEIMACIRHYYGVGVETFMLIKSGTTRKRDSGHPTPEISEHIPAFVREIIQDALSVEATDIHFEPFGEQLRVRYRIDGVLYETPLPAGINTYRKAIVSSIKIMAQLNIAERRMPQDGRFDVKIDGESFDIRVSVLPSQFGETLNLRLLNRQATFLDLDELGLEEGQLQKLEGLISLPYGMILFTGPTGSGKTTSLYAAMDRLNDSERKIITLEDPIEYQIHGITQMQVAPHIGFSFANGLRSILRHDPDVVLIGEIRDGETAEIAVSASLTGHLVFSTLHTNDSVAGIVRLVDMGIEPYLVASSLQGVVAQRLVRRICGRCREMIPLQEVFLEEARHFFPAVDEQQMIAEGCGCPFCRFTGYHGRIPIFEILELEDDLRQMIVQRASGTMMTSKAVEKGLNTLRQRGWEAVLAGTTTIEDLLRVTQRSKTRQSAAENPAASKNQTSPSTFRVKTATSMPCTNQT